MFKTSNKILNIFNWIIFILGCIIFYIIYFIGSMFTNIDLSTEEETFI